MSIDIYRDSINRLSREKANLEKSLGQEKEKLIRVKSSIASISRSITKYTSRSMVNFKQRQIETKEKEAVRIQKKIADIESKIVRKAEDITRNLKNLERAETQKRRKQDVEDRKRKTTELQHARAVTRETEKQLHLHSELKNSRLIIDLAILPKKIKVLFFAANPQDQTQLRLDEEIRSITEKIRLSEYRDSVELISKWAVRPSDLLQALNEHKPHIVHFSGHGSDTDQIIFLDPDGKSKPVSKKAIDELMRAMTDNVRVVIFNTCFSSSQAEAVTQHVDVAIGMSASIGDEAGRVFSSQFYSAIGFGRSVKDAFDQARAALMLQNIPEENTPQLFTRPGIDPDEIILVQPTSH